MDISIRSFDDRFNDETKDLIQDLSCLDPRTFSNLCRKGLPEHSMIKLANALKAFDKSITKTTLQEEILDLANHWDVIKKVV